MAISRAQMGKQIKNAPSKKKRVSKKKQKARRP
jgi:hypothetical protein